MKYRTSAKTNIPLWELINIRNVARKFKVNLKRVKSGCTRQLDSIGWQRNCGVLLT
ncbi:hypothetical protein LM599_02265 [Candidatus Acetothermia bacterium]|nr:hypothetical protein [Candidatus Acetothermia bacterium]MCI2427684.1 hypothetical protein [Candidatus Acetothermia bacterium]MCI2428385.1 hypothetical protein [Candidatus Acetothermia bacterium]